MEITGAVNTTLFSSPVDRSTGAVPAAPVTDTTAVSSSGSALDSPEENATRKAEPGQKSAEAEDRGYSSSELTAEEQFEIRELESRDTEVRQHELAHASVGGQFTGAAQLEYTRGPDGRLYATSGEVSVDTSSIADNPQATIEKMQTVIQAALAPADPSSQDRQVAAKAQALLAEAFASLANSESEEADKTSEEAEGAGESQTSSEEGEVEIGMDRTQVVEATVSKAENPFQTLASDTSVESGNLMMERRLVETGVFSKVFPEGSVIKSLV